MIIPQKRTNMVREISVETTEELFALLQSQKLFHTTNLFESVSPGKAKCIFRGQSHTKTLIPSALRGRNKLKDFCTQLMPKPKRKKPPHAIYNYLATQLISEIVAVVYFLEAADKEGVATHLDYEQFRRQYDIINGILQRSFSPQKKNIHNYTRDELEKIVFPSPELAPAIALAQHYGVPTRLLDFSESPYVALYWAAEKHLTTSPAKLKNKMLMLCAFNDGALGLSNPELMKQISVVRVPRYTNPNILRQKGIFLSLDRATVHFLDNNNWPSFESILEEHGALEYLLKIYIPATESHNILKELFNLDITRHSLMPSLENMAKSISYRKALFDY